MIIYPNYFTDRLIEITEFSKVAEHKINVKSVHFSIPLKTINQN